MNTRSRIKADLEFTAHESFPLRVEFLSETLAGGQRAHFALNILHDVILPLLQNECGRSVVELVRLLGLEAETVTIRMRPGLIQDLGKGSTPKF